MALGENTISGKMGLTEDGYVPQAMEVDTTQAEVLEIGATANESSALGPSSGSVGKIVVRLAPNASCWVTFGVNPTAQEATAGNVFLPSGAIEYVRMTAGHKVSVIQESAETGDLSVAVME